MKKLYSMSLVLNSDQYHAGLIEICHHFEGGRSDSYLNDLVRDLAQADDSLFSVMHIEQVRRYVKEESRQLTESLVAASRYIDSFTYVSDEAGKASALALLKLLASYDKPFSRMKVDERVGAVSALLRDLSQPAMEEHVNRLPDLPNRINRIQESLEDLKIALYERDKASGITLPKQPKMLLKRVADAKLEQLVLYLKAMAEKDPATYSGDFDVITQIITRLNTLSRSKSFQSSVKLSDEEEVTENNQHLVGA